MPHASEAQALDFARKRCGVKRGNRELLMQAVAAGALTIESGKFIGNVDWDAPKNVRRYLPEPWPYWQRRWKKLDLT